MNKPFSFIVMGFFCSMMQSACDGDGGSLEDTARACSEFCAAVTRCAATWIQEVRSLTGCEWQDGEDVALSICREECPVSADSWDEDFRDWRSSAECLDFVTDRIEPTCAVLLDQIGNQAGSTCEADGSTMSDEIFFDSVRSTNMACDEGVFRTGCAISYAAGSFCEPL